VLESLLCNSWHSSLDSLKLTLKPPYVDMHMMPGRMGTLIPLLRQSLTKTLYEGLLMKGMLRGKRCGGRDLHKSFARQIKWSYPYKFVSKNI
jgi:hypothetical protein